MKYFYIIPLFFLLYCNCSNANSGVSPIGNREKTVTIKSANSSSTYKINNNNQIIKSIYVNEANVTTTRSYSYNEENELNAIERNNPIVGTDHIYITVEKDRSANNRIQKKIKSIPNTRGNSDIFTVEYCYNENGNVIGMIQTDAYGNIVAKGINN